MADNLDITEGTGTSVATDQVGSDHYQKIKLADGTADSSTMVAVDIGAKANALRVAPANNITDGTYIGDIKFGEALPAGTAAIGKLAANSGVDIGDVDILSIAAGDNNIGNVDIVTVPAPLNVVGGGAEATALRVTIANDSTGVITVDGTVTANLSATDNAVLDTIDSVLDTISGNITACNTGAVVVSSGTITANLGATDNAVLDTIDAVLDAINAKLVTGTVIGDVNLGATDNAVLDVIAGDTTSLDGKVTACNTGAVVLATGSAAIGKLAANTGVDIGDVDVTSIIPGVAATNLGKAEDAVHASGDVGVMVLAVRDDAPSASKAAEGDYTPLLTNATGQLYIIDPTANALVTTSNTSLATIAGDTTSLDTKVTACNTGAVVLSSGTVTTVSTVTNLAQMGGTALSMDEGTVDGGCQRVTLATDDDGVAHLATIAGDTTNIETAIQIIDDWDSTHDSAASTDGPQMMAAYDSTKPTAIGDGDAVRVLADSYGRLLTGVEPQRFQAVFDSADATAEANVVKASAASTIIVVQSYVISSDVEGWIKLQDEDSTALTGKMWLKAGGGVAITLPENAPIVLGVDKDLEAICEAAGNVSVSVTGYTIPG